MERVAGLRRGEDGRSKKSNSRKNRERGSSGEISRAYSDGGAADRMGGFLGQGGCDRASNSEAGSLTIQPMGKV